MAASWLNRLFTKKSRSCRESCGQTRFLPNLECLTERIAPAITASFSPTAGVLSVVGDAVDNTITVSRDVAGTLLVNDGTIAVTGGTPTVTNVSFIQVSGQAGNDNILLNEANGALPRANLTGGTGDDTLTGGSGADQFFGEAGDDVLIGGAGNDFFQWGPDNGKDTMEGQDGIDTLVFFGSNASENIDIAANGGRVRFSRDVENVTMDLDDVESIDMRVWGGADNVVVGDLSGTDVTLVGVDLRGPMGGGDGQADTITVNGSQEDDVFGAWGDAGGIHVFGLQARVTIFYQEQANDHLTLNGHGGADRIDATSLEADAIQLTMNGGLGDDVMIGSEGDDLFTGGAGNDTVLMGLGNDTFVWIPGDDTDTVDGQAGTDTVEVNGEAGAEVFTATANGTRVRFDRLDPSPFSLDIGTSENVVVNANDGDDAFSATGNLAALITITVDGGEGNDTLLGSNGADVLIGGDGDDFLDGNQGSDLALMGAGDDVFQWDPGDGSDTVEGEDGSDRMLFNGSAASEVFDVSANADRVRFTRNIGNISMDLDEVERIDLNARGGVDTVTVNDVSGTDLTEINIDLAGTSGTAGDATADTVIVNGTNGDDIIDVYGWETSVAVVGLPALVNLTNVEGTNDALVVNALDGSDGVTASTMVAGIVKLTADGGAGDDTILGSKGNDVLIGGDDADFIYGDEGNDTAWMGAGDDLFQWDADNGNDTVEGQDGSDTIVLWGSDANENMDLSANGGRVRFSRDVASITLDLDDVERMDLWAWSGADNIVVGDLSGTDMTLIGIELRGPEGGDGAADTITVNGTQGDDGFGVMGDAGWIHVFGLRTTVNIFYQEQANDHLTLNAQGGADVVDATSLEADGIQLTMNGGLGDDLMIGSEGDDRFTGGDGNDTVFMGDGDDTFVWSPGDDNDTVEGQAGIDTLVFNGNAAAETINISANGDRVQVFRSIANITLDLDEVERIDLNARGGVDTITVNDVSGTDLVEINIDLAGTGGTAGDAQVDTVIVNGTNGDDHILVESTATGVSVLGLSAVVNLTNSEVAQDKLHVNTSAGNDVVGFSVLTTAAIQFAADGGAGTDTVEVHGEAGSEVFTATANGTRVRFDRLDPSPFSLDIGTSENVVVNANDGDDAFSATGNLAALITITVDGGEGNDTLLGSNGADVLIGGDGDDFLDGNQGNDTARMGAGDDVFQWDPGDGSDTVEGEDGSDRMLFNGSAGSEVFDVSANGARVRFTRNIGNISMDLDEVEQIDLNARGGVDTITVGDVSGTDLTEMNIDLAGIGGTAGDATADTVILNGTNGNDTALLHGDAGGVSVAGLAALVNITGSEPANDLLVVRSLAGDDVVDAAGLSAGAIQLVVDGGDDDDLLIGSAGDDTLSGGDGNDTLIGGAGLDVLDGGLGNNIVIQ